MTWTSSLTGRRPRPGHPWPTAGTRSRAYAWPSVPPHQFSERLLLLSPVIRLAHCAQGSPLAVTTTSRCPARHLGPRPGTAQENVGAVEHSLLMTTAEAGALLAFLDAQRQCVLAIVDGLDEDLLTTTPLSARPVVRHNREGTGHVTGLRT